jgi:hypothetical protein
MGNIEKLGTKTSCGSCTFTFIDLSDAASGDSTLGLISSRDNTVNTAKAANNKQKTIIFFMLSPGFIAYFQYINYSIRAKKNCSRLAAQNKEFFASENLFKYAVTAYSYQHKL